MSIDESFDYAAVGRLGLGTPQANPTVEPEFRRLLPLNAAMYTVRLTSEGKHARERLVDYLTHLGAILRRYDTLVLDGFGFACTGSSYLVGLQAERDLCARLEDTLGYSVITAAGALSRSLELLAVRRFALVAPYPDWLVEAGREYWSHRGFEVATMRQIRLPGDDTRAIYELGGDVAMKQLEAVAGSDVDAIVFSGTGLPTLEMLSRAPQITEKPVMSSNSCLASAMLAIAGRPPS